MKKEAEHAHDAAQAQQRQARYHRADARRPALGAAPAELDTINFDDFVRAAIVGYARGDGAQ